MKFLFSFLLLSLCSVCFAQPDDGRIVRIPVVFHILYADSSADNGIDSKSRDRGNSSQYITSEKIRAELKDLNNDFMLLNADTAEVLQLYKSIMGNAKVDFYLADTMIQQGGEKGMIRMRTKNNKSKLYNTSPVINPLKYLNVYIGNVGSSFVNSYPWDDKKNDAIYLGYEWVGLDYRLLTHETGHWLGLWHIYGGSGKCKGDKCKGDGDEIDDTPPQKNCTNTDCVSCPPDVADQSCVNGIPSNYNNYMDYSSCRKMFTMGQVKKMREILKVHRNEMWKVFK